MPIKVQLNSMCTGVAVTLPVLHITVVQGNYIEDDTAVEDPNLVAESVSNADTGTQMRNADSMYIYNFNTKTLKTPNVDYTIRIRSGGSTGPVILRALFQPKK